jgi:TolB protein
MKLRPYLSFVLTATALGFSARWCASAQQPSTITIVGSGQIPNIAVIDFRATGAAQAFMAAFNATVLADLQGSPLVKVVPKTLYPIQFPQTATDLLASQATTDARPKTQVGLHLSDWSIPPVNANYLGFGYGVEQNGQFIVFGYFYNTSSNMPSIQQAQVFGKPYTAALELAGVTRVAHQYAADILAQFGGKSLVGTRIIFVSDRTGNKEIWSMNYDGTEQSQITHYNTISTFPSVSPDGKKLAFTSWLRGRPEIVLFSLETLRRLPFYNQQASMNAFVDFTPDSKRVIFSSTANGGPAQLFTASVDGSDLHRLSSSTTIEVEPKINPKTGAEIAFVSGRTGMPQVYRMTIEGADLQRLSNGEGEATNPAWAPDGQHLAFAWTKGFEPGNYNVFVMDVPTRNIVQLTSNEGRNENPSWAPDNAHIAYASKRGGKSQIWVMGADGKGKQQLTNQGSNEKPVWIQAVQ